MATANQDPANIGLPMAQVVNFTTTNLSNGDPFVEPHTVSGPTGSYNVPVSVIPISGNKIVIPLTSDTSAGASFLKLHLPQPNSSAFYVTFCVKNNAMQDGYYDYTTGIPSDYRTDFRLFTLDGANSIPSGGASYSKTLVFQVLGLDTNVASAAIQYTVTLAATFGGTTTTTGNSAKK
jgi:hypothetical protein